MTAAKERSTVIRASEIGQWAYCQRAWWLARQGHENRNVAALQAGIQAHTAHGQNVAAAQRSRILAFALLLIGMLVLAVTLLLAFL